MAVSKPSKRQIRYWEKVLQEHGLGMKRGELHWLLYGWQDREDLGEDDAFDYRPPSTPGQHKKLCPQSGQE